MKLHSSKTLIKAQERLQAKVLTESQKDEIVRQVRRGVTWPPKTIETHHDDHVRFKFDKQAEFFLDLPRFRAMLDWAYKNKYTVYFYCDAGVPTIYVIP